jgi:hypothetical protein
VRHDSEHTRPGREAPKRGARDLLAGITSGFIGALALATSLYNVYLQRQQVRAQVWPKLTIQDANEGERVGFSIANRGVGPADVKRTRVLVDGVPAKSWVNAIQTLRHEKEILAPLARDLDTTIGSGQEMVFIAYPVKDWMELQRERGRVTTEICYCSTLGECWQLTTPWNGRDVTTPVAECRPDPVPFIPYTAAQSEQLIANILAFVGDGGTRDAGVEQASSKP